MKNTALIIAIFMIASQLSFGQYSYPAKQTHFDIAIAGGDGGFSPALSFSKLFGVTKDKRFKIGYGVRLTSYFSKTQNFITAPAKLTSGTQSIVALFTENIASNLDTLRLSKVQTNAVNLTINLQYSIRKLDVGFNIDALGFTFGGKQKGVFYSQESKSLNQSNQTASPTHFNALLISDSDRGSLNSEFYARYSINDRIGLRAGASFQFIEYTTDRKLTFENDRFRLKTFIPFIAISFSPSK